MEKTLLEDFFIHSIVNSFKFFNEFCHKNFHFTKPVVTWPEGNNGPTFLACWFCTSKLFKYYDAIKTFCYGSLCSSGAEHWSRKPGVVSSILTGGNSYCFAYQKFLFCFWNYISIIEQMFIYFQHDSIRLKAI